MTERKRVYSKTYFYAGSFWNVYIQKVKSSNKSPQLGVYLHRAKEREQDLLGAYGPDRVMISGTVDERIGYLEREMQANADSHARRNNRRRYTAERAADVEAGVDVGMRDPSAPLVPHSRFSTNHPGLSTFMTGGSQRSTGARHSLAVPDMSSYGATGLEDSSSNESSEDEDDRMNDAGRESQTWFKRPAISTLPPYIDARPTVTTYFKIYSPSKGGRMLSLYESAPDYFDFSQSWGWKSSTLMVDDDEDAG